jgi:hypothetical protein
MLCKFYGRKQLHQKTTIKNQQQQTKQAKKATNSNKQLQHTFLNIKQQLNQAEDLLVVNID